LFFSDILAYEAIGVFVQPSFSEKKAEEGKSPANLAGDTIMRLYIHLMLNTFNL
jgi:hypothetical protein